MKLSYGTQQGQLKIKIAEIGYFSVKLERAFEWTISGLAQ
jgi:hypothetical protein